MKLLLFVVLCTMVASSAGAWDSAMPKIQSLPSIRTSFSMDRPLQLPDSMARSYNGRFGQDYDYSPSMQGRAEIQMNKNFKFLTGASIDSQKNVRGDFGGEYRTDGGSTYGASLLAKQGTGATFDAYANVKPNSQATMFARASDTEGNKHLTVGSLYETQYGSQVAGSLTVGNRSPPEKRTMV